MLRRILRRLIEQSLVPSFDCGVSRDGRVVFRQRFPETGPEPVFDTASLTKPLVTFPLVRKFFGTHPLSLIDIIPTAGISVSLEKLLTHRAGLKPWLPLYLYPETYPESIRLRGFDSAEMPVQPVYSCLGYILLSRALEQAAGESFSEIVTRFLEKFPGCEINPGPRPDVVPTERGNRYELKLAEDFVRHPDLSRFRLGRIIHGEPHDLNAYYDGGISGNAGLFATVDGILALTQAVLQREDAFLPMMTGDGYRYHLGFTGTGIAISEDRRTVVVFLSNHVHPAVRADDFSSVRHGIFRAGMEMAS